MRVYDELDKMIVKLLHDLTLRPNYKGFRYILDAVRIILRYPDGQCLITKDVYPVVARENATTSASVERCIRHCVETIWDYAPAVSLEDFLFLSAIERPTNSVFLVAVAVNIMNTYGSAAQELM
ncbi:MAG: sporulation initiation factor Spo0A [Ruminococcaceae bacterium]|nr:sporulation initiation factor Spo0A [Oscillospiraceae bacterium]